MNFIEYFFYRQLVIFHQIGVKNVIRLIFNLQALLTTFAELTVFDYFIIKKKVFIILLLYSTYLET